MLANVGLDQRLQQPPLLRRQRSRLHQVLGQRLLLGQYPGLHARNELLARDEIHLQREDAEQQISIGRRSHSSNPGGRNWKSTGEVTSSRYAARPYQNSRRKWRQP